MSKPRTPRPPKIIMRETDADRLSALAEPIADANPAASLLLDEIARAEVRADAKVPAGVVAMGSVVEFVDEASGAERTVRLVYPAEADIAVGKISVLSPVGAGLIGLSAGQTIHWPDRDGRTRRLRGARVGTGTVWARGRPCGESGRP